MAVLFFRSAAAQSLTSILLLLAGCRLAAPVAPAAVAGQFQLGDGDRILVLAPHPDDEVLGAGGVLREAVEQGIPVRVVFLTHGDSNEWSFLFYRKRPVVLPRAALTMGTIRQREAVVAAEALGVPAADLTFLGYPDYGTLGIWRFHWGSRPPDRGRLTRARAVPYSTAFRPGAPFKGEEILADLETLILEFRPTRIFVSHPADHHPDHAALYLFTRVALWDLQGEVAATLHPFLVHYPRWPGRKGFRPAEELSPPARLLAGFNWQTRGVNEEEIAAKRQALTAHRTQWRYSASRLLPFVRPNELYGDLAIPQLRPGGAVRLLEDPVGEQAASAANDEEGEASELVDLHGLSVKLARDQVEIGMDLREPLPEGSAVSLSAFGYRPDVPFAAMPKLEVRIEPHAYAVRDQLRLRPRSTAWAATRGRKLMARIPLASLANPDRLFLQVRTSSPRTPLGQTPWWIVELRAAPATQQAAMDGSSTSESTAAAADVKAPW
ncbi:MAG TPA: PIG-L family deacetylase [Thermoanaerobaculia bacterium]|jgi:LmbE family N-acetylglucosaminyl deacetylase|nr:PIG-L family deacetylase [Thermoanaerobaculia bacterium]